VCYQVIYRYVGFESVVFEFLASEVCYTISLGKVFKPCFDHLWEDVSPKILGSRPYFLYGICCKLSIESGDAAVFSLRSLPFEISTTKICAKFELGFRV
jgi:hypothetical protein